MNGNNQTGETVLERGSDGRVPENDFLSLFCAKFGCRQQKFERRFFMDCVYPEGRDLARLINLVYPRCFRADYSLIDDIKHTTSFAEFKKMVDFHDAQYSPDGLIRGLFKARLSKTRLLNTARILFGGEN